MGAGHPRPGLTPADRHVTTIVIAGGGAAGLLAAIALVRHPAPGPRRIVLADPSGEPGTGVAYGTRSPSHLLNVRAAAMSALPDDPGHFLAWCQGEGLAVSGPDFVARLRYGPYLRATLATALAAAGPAVRMEIRHDRVTGIRAEGAGVAVTIGDTPVPVDAAILATGHPPARPDWIPDDPRAIADPWAQGALERIHPDGSVVIAGSGLTAVDLALVLADAGHRGPIRLVSRHGLLPAVHADGPLPARPAAIAPGDPGSDRIRSIARALRADAAGADDWRQAVDALRPVTVALWRGLPVAERRRFLRHGLRAWEVHRHRMAPEIAARVASLRAAGQLTVERGRIVSVRGEPAALQVTTRCGGRTETRAVDALIAATGPATDPAADPLLAALIAAGMARPHPLGFGLDVEPDGVLRRADGRPWPAVRAVGSLRKGAEWEATAVPELRLHAREAADALLRDG